MIAGDFVEVYGTPEYSDKFDCVVTCFFVDTAKNIFEYIETVANVLKHGGIWINLGPLLYHFSEMEDEISIELSYEEFRAAIVAFGFDLQREEILMSTYTANKKSLMQVMFRNTFFVAKLVREKNRIIIHYQQQQPQQKKCS